MGEQDDVTTGWFMTVERICELRQAVINVGRHVDEFDILTKNLETVPAPVVAHLIETIRNTVGICLNDDDGPYNNKKSTELPLPEEPSTSKEKNVDQDPTTTIISEQPSESTMTTTATTPTTTTVSTSQN